MVAPALVAASSYRPITVAAHSSIQMNKGTGGIIVNFGTSHATDGGVGRVSGRVEAGLHAVIANTHSRQRLVNVNLPNLGDRVMSANLDGGFMFGEVV